MCRLATPHIMKIKIFALIAIVFILGITLDYLNLLDREVGEPLYRIAFFAGVSYSLILLTRESHTLSTWVRFSTWWVPLTFILIAISPSTNGTWSPVLSLTKESMTWLMGGLFTIISLAIVIRSNRTSRTK